jgi:hypothetical protein
MGLREAEHVVVTTFNPDVKSVERIVQLSDGRIGFWTADAGAMADRFAEAQTVIVRICDRGGKVNFEQPLFEGRAEFVTEGVDFDAVKAAVAAKHGMAVKLENTVDRAKELFGRKTPEGAVVIDIVG